MFARDEARKRWNEHKLKQQQQAQAQAQAALNEKQQQQPEPINAAFYRTPPLLFKNDGEEYANYDSSKNEYYGELRGINPDNNFGRENINNNLWSGTNDLVPVYEQTSCLGRWLSLPADHHLNELSC